MKVAEIFQRFRRLFLDTAPVIYYVERHPKYGPVVDLIFDGIDDGRLPAVTSPITLSECLIVPHRLGDVVAQQNFAELIVHGQGVLFAVIDEGIAQQAAALRARYNVSLTDALQVATALVAACVRPKKFARLRGLGKRRMSPGQEKGAGKGDIHQN